MRKTVIMSIILTIFLLWVGCGNPQQSKSLYEHGMDLIELLEEMAESDSYVPLFTGSKELVEIVSVVKEGDYSEPKEVYEITLNEEVILNMAEGENLEGMSEELKKVVINKMHMAAVNQINASGGVESLAVASVCTAGKTFVSDELRGNMMYLYTYENGIPVIVTFTAGEDNTVAASGFFVFYDKFKTDGIEEIKASLGELAAGIEIVNR